MKTKAILGLLFVMLTTPVFAAPLAPLPLNEDPEVAFFALHALSINDADSIKPDRLVPLTEAELASIEGGRAALHEIFSSPTLGPDIKVFGPEGDLHFYGNTVPLAGTPVTDRPGF
jgi:hypothetical protein